MRFRSLNLRIQIRRKAGSQKTIENVKLSTLRTPKREGQEAILGGIGLFIAWGTHDSIFMVFGGIGDLVISTELSRNASIRPNVGGIGLSIAWGHPRFDFHGVRWNR